MIYRDNNGGIYYALSEYAIRAYVYHKGITVRKMYDVSLFRNNLRKIAGGVYAV